MKDGIPLDRVDAQDFERAAKEMEHYGEKKSPMPVVKTEPRIGAWTGSNQLGYEIPFDPSQTHPQTILKLDEWGFPEVWTVSLAARFDKELLTTQVFDALATVNFGAGGITQTFDVDFVAGTVFSLPMNAINILATWKFDTLGPITPPGVHLSVVLARGRVGKTRATYSFQVLAPSAGPVNVYKVPAFAKSVQILPRDPSDNSLYADPLFVFRFHRNPGTSIVGSVIGTTLGNVGTKIPIPAFAQYWSVDDLGGAGGYNVDVIFNLFDE